MILVIDVKNILNKARFVNKTLLIPYWLNVAAEKKHINSSSVLQEELKERLENSDYSHKSRVR